MIWIKINAIKSVDIYVYIYYIHGCMYTYTNIHLSTCINIFMQTCVSWQQFCKLKHCALTDWLWVTNEGECLPHVTESSSLVPLQDRRDLWLWIYQFLSFCCCLQMPLPAYLLYVRLGAKCAVCSSSFHVILIGA